MGAGGKSGSARKSKNYYGTIAATFCWGPLDWLTAVIVNGNYMWQCASSGPLMLAGAINGSGYVDLTGGLLDPSIIAAGGYVHFYAGTSTQAADPALPGHPPYRDTPVLVAKHIFFGQESGTCPNIQIVGGRVPRVPTTIVAAADNYADDRQINPVAALAEILLDERGAGLAVDGLDAPSWLAAAHWCAQDKAHRDFAFLSPLISEPTQYRDLVRVLLEPIGGFLRRTPAGKLGCYIYEWGIDPGGLPLLDARHFARRPKFSDTDWAEVPTEVFVTFTDRAYEFQENSVVVPNVRARIIRKVDDQARLERKHVTRLGQAQRQGQEYNHRMGLGPGRGKLGIRAPFAGDLLPGDKLFIDIDPEPGSEGFAQLARVDKITSDRSEEVTLEVTIDTLLGAEAYTPEWISPLPETTFPDAVAYCPPLAHVLAIPLPPAKYGWPPPVALLASRAGRDVIGFTVLFSPDPAGGFADLGSQSGFAALATLVTSIDGDDTVLRLQLVDGADGPDAYIAAGTPGGNASVAADDTLLAILVALDGDGRVAIDAGGYPQMEFCSIVERSAVSADTHDYTVLRGRMTLPAAAWAAGVVVWIVPRVSLEPWTHVLFASLVDDDLYFRAIAYTDAASDESDTPPATELTLPAFLALPPTGFAAVAGTGKAVSLSWVKSPDPTVIETLIYRSGTNDPDTATLIARVTGTRFVDLEVDLGTTYYYWASSGTAGDPESAKTAAASATTVAVPGTAVAVQYSIDGATSWHDTWVAGDLYWRFSTDGSVTWGAAQRFIGATGAPGATAHFWVKYSNDGGTSFTGSGGNVVGKWIGTRADFAASASATPGDYTWILLTAVAVQYSIDGATSWHDTWVAGDLYWRFSMDGSVTWGAAQRFIGATGAPGATAHFWVKYSNDGGTSFTGSGGDVVGKWIGTRADFAASASATPGDYTWILLQGYIDPTPPANPAAPTFADSGSKTAADGAVTSWIEINLPAMPVGAEMLTVKARVVGDSGWVTFDEPTAGGGTSTINDLSPGVSYDIAVQAFSHDNQGSAIVVATGSPFVAPVKTSLPTAPTGYGLTGDGVVPQYFGGTSIFRVGVRVYWAPCPDSDYDHTEVKATLYDDATSTTYSWTAIDNVGGVVLTKERTVCLYNPLFYAGYVFMRHVNRSGGASAWVRVGEASTVGTIGTGTIAGQNTNAVEVTGLKTGGAGARKVRARFPFDIVTTYGAGAEPAINIDISGRGFTTKPDGTSAINVSSDPATKARYDWDDVANTSTNAVVKLSHYDGTAMLAGTVRLQGEFFEYY